jgi:hypothetical protein
LVDRARRTSAPESAGGAAAIALPMPIAFRGGKHPGHFILGQVLANAKGRGDATAVRSFAKFGPARQKCDDKHKGDVCALGKGTG